MLNDVELEKLWRVKATVFPVVIVTHGVVTHKLGRGLQEQLGQWCSRLGGYLESGRSVHPELSRCVTAGGWASSSPLPLLYQGWIIMSILSSIPHYTVTYLTQTLLRLLDVWATAYVTHSSSCCEVDLLDSNLDLLFQRCHYTIQLYVTWLLTVAFLILSEATYVILMAGILEKRPLPSGYEMGPNYTSKTKLLLKR